jgi:putative flippase GtrA
VPLLSVDQNSHKSIGQLARYLAVGVFNTAFGYGVFALSIWAFRGFGPYGYMYATVAANLITITAAFLGYKRFVFRTRGNYLIEWIRCIGVYGTTMLIGLAAMPILVPILRHHLASPQSAPYIAAAITTLVTVAFSFLGHKNISFREGWSERA